MLRTLVITLVALGACAGSTEPGIAGRASVIDGDTLELHGQRIRLWGVDAPEGRQTCERAGASYRCGQEAANRLDQWLAGRTVTCVQVDTDRYQRVVARCAVGGQDIGGWLVRNSLAVRYARYAGPAYLIEETAARSDHAGVWAGTFELPWDWRSDHRGSR